MPAFRHIIVSVFVLVGCISLTSLTALTVQAQGINGGSNYSYFGIGDIRESLGGAYEGMGGVGIGVTSPYAINFTNPAAWSSLKTTRFQTGFTFRQFQVTNTQDGQASQNNGEVQGFSTAFAVDTTMGVGVSLGITPASNVSFAFTKEQVQAITLYTGKGGLSQIHLGASVRPLSGLSAGLMVKYLFGNRTEIITSQPSDQNAYASTTKITDKFSGLGFTLGLQYTGLENWTFGAIAAFSTKLSIDRQTLYRFTVIPDIIDTVAGETTMPLTFGVGIGHRIGRTSVFIDAVTKDFSSFSYQTGNDAVVFRRANRLSLGISYAGSTEYNASLFESLTYNLGFGYHQQYYQINNTGINEMYGSFGLGIPVTRRAMLDASVTAGVRGTVDGGLLQERFARFSFSINIGEVWFQPFARE